MEFPVWIIPTSTLSLLSSFNCFAISAFLSFFNLSEKYVLNPKKLAKRLQLQVHFDEMEAQVEIYPLLFVPLVENAFKYVGGNYFIAMDMCLKEGKLCFSIENSIPEPLVHQKGKHGIGIENLRRRLELLYPERHTLDINRGDTLFRVKLVIEL